MDKQFNKATYKDNDVELDINISLEERTAWLSIKQIALLFNRTRSAISKSIKSIIASKMFEIDSVSEKISHTGDDGKVYEVKAYNVDIILEIGNRVKSNKGILLKQFVDNYISNYYIENSNDIIIYNNGNISLDVKIAPKEDTVWLSQEQIAVLFDTNKQLVSYHVSNILQDDELDASTVKEILTVQSEGDRNITRNITNYNLDMIISIGYRINSKRAIEFRKWATRVLKEYLLRGYVINKDRTLVTNENYINLINKVDNLDNRISKLENNTDYYPKNYISYENDRFKGVLFVKGLVSNAKANITLIDPYTDVNTLKILDEKKKNVRLLIITSSENKLIHNDIDVFDYDNETITVKINNDYHDRYLIIDNNYFYRFGASIKDIGNKFSQVDLIIDEDIIKTLRRRVELIELTKKDD